MINKMVRGIFMKKWLVAILLGVLLVLGACGGSNSGDTGGDSGGTTEASAGEELYKKQCASCHGTDLAGVSGPGLENVGSSLSSDEILDIIENGQGSMPPGLLTGDDAKEVADWLAEQK